MKYEEALEFLQNTGKLGINLGLERIIELLAALDNPHEKIKTIHVAGTNGKGSTIAMLNSILSEAGFKVGVYTSPHLHTYTERIKINNQLITEDEFARETLELKDILLKVCKVEQDSPTEFEMLTAIAFNYFYKKKVDIAIIEVGMGGRLDSTNVLKPLFSIITSIDKDHESFLGSTYEKIALEKAGILKNNTPLVLGKQRQECEHVLITEAHKKKSSIYFSQEVNTRELFCNEMGQNIAVTSKFFKGELFLALLGDHQRDNMEIVLTSLDLLSKNGFVVGEDEVRSGLRKVKWPGRMEFIKAQRRFLLDGAHNPQGAEALNRAIGKYFSYKNLIVILGILGDKDQEKIIKHILSLTPIFIVTKPNNIRVTNWRRVGEIIEKKSKAQVIYEENVEEAIGKAVNLTNQEDLICITGSLYLIGEARQLVLNRFFEYKHS